MGIGGRTYASMPILVLGGEWPDSWRTYAKSSWWGHKGCLEVYPVSLAQLRLQASNSGNESICIGLLFSFLASSLLARFRLLLFIGVTFVIPFPSPAFASVWFGTVRCEVANLLAIVAHTGFRVAIRLRPRLSVRSVRVTFWCSPLLSPFLMSSVFILLAFGILVHQLPRTSSSN